MDRSEWGIGWTKMGARLDNHITAGAVASDMIGAGLQNPSGC